MIDLSTVDHIYLVTGSTDLRKAADGCSAIVQYDLNMNPFTKDIFLFCNRHKNTIQILGLSKISRGDAKIFGGDFGGEAVK